MYRVIVVESCNSCPYCINAYTEDLRIYTGTSCTHPENKNPKFIFLGGSEDRESVHPKCPLAYMQAMPL